MSMYCGPQPHPPVKVGEHYTLERDYAICFEHTAPVEVLEVGAIYEGWWAVVGWSDEYDLARREIVFTSALDRPVYRDGRPRTVIRQDYTRK